MQLHPKTSAKPIIPEAKFWHANTAAEKDQAASFFIEGKSDLGMNKSYRWQF